MAEWSQPGGDRLGHLAHAGALAAHAADDVRREANPDLLVVLELGMVLQVLDRRRPRRRIPLGVERQAVARPSFAIALGPKEGARLGEREVDVEENRVDGAAWNPFQNEAGCRRNALGGTLPRPRLRP